MKITAFFGDAEHAFILTDPMISELERLAGMGIGAFYRHVVGMQFRLADLAQVIRLGLIGAGTDPKEALQLVETYAHNRPIAEIFPLALDILEARWTGTTPDKDNPA